MYNPYQFNPYFPQMQRLQQMEQQYPQFAQQQQQSYPQQNVLQGKTVDSIEVVRAIDIPLDGSTSFFPIADGSAIITKQLQADGTSKIVTYLPSKEPTKDLEPKKYLTEQDVKEIFENDFRGISDVQNDIKELKREVRNLSEDFSELKTKKRKSDE